MLNLAFAYRIWLENAFYFRTSVFGRWTKKSGGLGPKFFQVQIQIFNDIFVMICLLETESTSVTEFEFSKFQPFFYIFMTWSNSHPLGLVYNAVVFPH